MPRRRTRTPRPRRRGRISGWRRPFDGIADFALDGFVLLDEVNQRDGGTGRLRSRQRQNDVGHSATPFAGNAAVPGRSGCAAGRQHGGRYFSGGNLWRRRNRVNTDLTQRSRGAGRGRASWPNAGDVDVSSLAAWTGMRRLGRGQVWLAPGLGVERSRQFVAAEQFPVDGATVTAQ